MSVLEIIKIKDDAVAVYINSSIFNRVSNILNQITFISRDCFDSPTVLSPNMRNNVLLAYMNTEKKEQTEKLLNLPNQQALNVINANANYIQAFLRMELYPDTNHVEIYDECTARKFRSRGAMNNLFKNLFDNLPEQYRYIWLGVLINTDNRDTTLKFYLKKGFEIVGVTNRSLSGKQFRFNFVSMVKDKDKELPAAKINADILRANRTIYEFLSELRCNFLLYLNWNDIIKIQKLYAHKEREYGGHFILRNFGRDVYLVPNLKSIQEGGEDLTVPIQNEIFTWHTHPYICYEKKNCYIGWPSGQDMTVVFNHYLKGGLVHFVFSNEGAYGIKLTTEMMKFIYLVMFNNEWIDSISKMILIRFGFIENFRSVIHDEERLKCLEEFEKACLIYPSDKQEENIRQFLDKANNRTLNEYNFAEFLIEDEYKEYIETLEEVKFFVAQYNEYLEEAMEYYTKATGRTTDFPVFEAVFYRSYDKADQNLRLNINTIKAPNNPFCFY